MKSKENRVFYQLADRYVQLYGDQLLAEQGNLEVYRQETPDISNPRRWIKAQRRQKKWRGGGRIAAAGVGLILMVAMIAMTLPFSLRIFDKASAPGGERVTEDRQYGETTAEGVPPDDNVMDLGNRQRESVDFAWSQLAQAAGYTLTESRYKSEDDVFFFRLSGEDGEIIATAQAAIDSDDLRLFERRQIASRAIYIGQFDGINVLIYQPLNRAYRFESNADINGLLDFFEDAAPFLDSMID